MDDVDPRPAGGRSLRPRCTTLDDVIYVFGGRLVDTSEASNAPMSFDPSRPTGERWSTNHAPAPVAGMFAAAVPYGDRLIVTGFYTSGTGTPDVLAYVSASDEWVAFTDLPDDHGAAAAWVHDDVLYVGGRGFDTYLDTVLSYDLILGTAGTWEPSEPLIQGCRTMAHAVDPDTGWLYIVCGWNGGYMGGGEVGRLVVGLY